MSMYVVCPSPPPPESLTESRYKNPQQTQAQTDRTHDTLGSVLAAETVVQYSLSHSSVNFICYDILTQLMQSSSTDYNLYGSLYVNVNVNGQACEP
jgi:hypothetical protein